jgi:hypothetical protein
LSQPDLPGLIRPVNLSKARALLKNIRISGNGLPGTNTLTYNEYSKIMSIKSFMKLAPGRFNQYQTLEGVEHSSLFCPTISDEEKKIYKSGAS